MMSHLKDCLVESPSLSGNADGENEVEGVKVKKKNKKYDIMQFLQSAKETDLQEYDSR